MAPKKRTMPLEEKMKFPVGIGSRHFSFFLSMDNVYFPSWDWFWAFFFFLT